MRAYLYNSLLLDIAKPIKFLWYWQNLPIKTTSIWNLIIREADEVNFLKSLFRLVQKWAQPIIVSSYASEHNNSLATFTHCLTSVPLLL